MVENGLGYVGAGAVLYVVCRVLRYGTAAIVVHVDVSVEKVVENGLGDVGAGAVLYVGCRVVERVHVVSLLLPFLPSSCLEQLEGFVYDLEIKQND